MLLIEIRRNNSLEGILWVEGGWAGGVYSRVHQAQSLEKTLRSQGPVE